MQFPPAFIGPPGEFAQQKDARASVGSTMAVIPEGRDRKIVAQAQVHHP